ncbi:hypothetical protein BDR07DRAFT_1394771 [Suillus spraguei]|nr:hypothetical protein BDR07DRAFT_1394771 [Suillus spraguei]
MAFNTLMVRSGLFVKALSVAAQWVRPSHAKRFNFPQRKLCVSSNNNICIKPRALKAFISHRPAGACHAMNCEAL